MIRVLIGILAVQLLACLAISLIIILGLFSGQASLYGVNLVIAGLFLGLSGPTALKLFGLVQSRGEWTNQQRSYLIGDALWQSLATLVLILIVSGVSHRVFVEGMSVFG